MQTDKKHGVFRRGFLREKIVFHEKGDKIRARGGIFYELQQVPYG